MVVNGAHGHSSQVTRVQEYKLAIHSQLANKAIMFVTVTCLVFLPFLFARSSKSVACSLPACNSKNNQDTWLYVEIFLYLLGTLIICVFYIRIRIIMPFPHIFMWAFSRTIHHIKDERCFSSHLRLSSLTECGMGWCSWRLWWFSLWIVGEER